MNDRTVITIGREFGSGGHEVGVKLAQRLGVKCYDKELLAAAAKESHWHGDRCHGPHHRCQRHRERHRQWCRHRLRRTLHAQREARGHPGHLLHRIPAAGGRCGKPAGNQHPAARRHQLARRGGGHRLRRTEEKTRHRCHTPGEGRRRGQAEHHQPPAGPATPNS
mgnify:CR=1 FL=1